MKVQSFPTNKTSIGLIPFWNDKSRFYDVEIMKKDELIDDLSEVMDLFVTADD